MGSWTWLLTDPLWRTALTVIPLVLGVAVICHFVPLLPATRHTLWLVVLLWLIASPLLPASSMPGLLARLIPHGGAPSEQLALAPASPDQASAAVAQTPAIDTSSAVPSASDTNPIATAFAPDIPTASDVIVNSTPRPRVPPAARPAPVLMPDLPISGAYPPDRPGQVPTSSAVLVEIQTPAPRASAESEHSDDARWRAMQATAPPEDLSAAEAPRGDSSSEIAGSATSAAPASDGSLPRAENAPSKASAWRTWIIGLRAVRDALVRLPSMPVNVWLGGMALLLSIQFVRCLRARCALRAAVIAPASVTGMVREVAGALGMRQVPETLMVAGQLSPMITCGRRPRLVLPRALWGQLDYVSRRAVICHELAHLRRRDHWIRWCQLTACALYWWHPVAWWVRRRLSEEAELCCDAWVTWLMPQQRRAYAEALLKTKQYVCAQDARVPAVGIGVTTRRARRFARRLKMVMTANTRPGLSVAGILLALGVALCGWLTAPVWACPPESKAAKADQPAPAAVAIPAEAPHAVIVATETGDDDDDDAPQGTYEKHMAAKKAPKAKSPKAPKAAQPFMFSFNGGQGSSSGATAWPAPPSTPPSTPEPGGRPGRDDLERRMERLERQLERLSERLEQMSSGPGQSIPGRGPRASGGGIGRAQTAPLPREDDDGKVITRVYKLPDGKRDALIEFLRRDDVPVRISPAPVDGGIEVHGTPRQHEVFKAFIDLINPSERRGAALEPASPLMGLRNRLGDLSQLKALEALRSDDGSRLSRELVERLTREKTSLFEAQKRQIEAQQNNLRRQAEQLRAQAEHMRQEAERLRENAQQLLQKAQEMRERSDASQNEHEKQAAEHEAQSVENEARSAEEHAEQIEASTDSIDERAVAFESQAEELEGALDVPEP
ncbi:MAG TPA: M56 family metallopeptidase [Phycisphaerae bacterium]|jgi:beta-lactamase regulating signal transducer with metallopeptidase domain